MTPDASLTAPASDLLVVDLIDEDTGLADVEDQAGRTYQIPALWLPAVAEGAAYRVEISAQGVSFTPESGGARRLRERSKQTLLDFADDPEQEE